MPNKPAVVAPRSALSEFSRKARSRIAPASAWHAAWRDADAEELRRLAKSERHIQAAIEKRKDAPESANKLKPSQDPSMLGDLIKLAASGERAELLPALLEALGSPRLHPERAKAMRRAALLSAAEANNTDAAKLVLKIEPDLQEFLDTKGGDSAYASFPALKLAAEHGSAECAGLLAAALRDLWRQKSSIVAHMRAVGSPTMPVNAERAHRRARPMIQEALDLAAINPLGVDEAARARTIKTLQGHLDAFDVDLASFDQDVDRKRTAINDALERERVEKSRKAAEERSRTTVDPAAFAALLDRVASLEGEVQSLREQLASSRSARGDAASPGSGSGEEPPEMEPRRFFGIGHQRKPR